MSAATYDLGYAYPTSINAALVRRSKQGAHTIKTAQGLEGFDTLEQAQARIAELRAQGYVPDRWSLDHPKNAHLYNPAPFRLEARK